MVLNMLNNKLEILFSRLATECGSYIDKLVLKSKGDIVSKASKTSFMVELLSFAEDGDCMGYLDDNDRVLENTDSITAEALFQHYADTEGNHFDTYEGLSELIDDYCFRGLSVFAKPIPMYSQEELSAIAEKISAIRE